MEKKVSSKDLRRTKLKAILDIHLEKENHTQYTLPKKNNCIFVTDDKRARRFANDLDIATTGTLGIIIASVKNNRL